MKITLPVKLQDPIKTVFMKLSMNLSIIFFSVVYPFINKFSRFFFLKTSQERLHYIKNIFWGSVIMKNLDWSVVCQILIKINLKFLQMNKIFPEGMFDEVPLRILRISPDIPWVVFFFQQQNPNISPGLILTILQKFFQICLV